MQLLIRDNRTFELESPSTSVILHIVVALSYLATFLDTNSLSGLMCRKAVNQSIPKLWSWGANVYGQMPFLTPTYLLLNQ